MARLRGRGFGNKIRLEHEIEDQDGVKGEIYQRVEAVNSGMYDTAERG